MASRLPRLLLRHTKGRLYATQAATAQTDQKAQYVPPEAAKVTKVNGFTVASVESFSPLARIGVVVRAGSRYEPRKYLGVSHVLRHSSMLSNDSNTGFRTIKLFHQTGGNFTVSTTKEYIYYTWEGTRNQTNVALAILLNIATTPRLRPWEFSNIKGPLKFDLAMLNNQPNVRAVDLLHEAAFRDTLGQSLYCEPARLETMTHTDVMDYMKIQYTASNIGVVGVGVDHGFLIDEVQEVEAYGEGTPENKPAVYRGGETREEYVSPMTYAAVVTEGPSLHSKDLLCAGVLQYVMGTGPYTKYSTGKSGSRLIQAVSKATDSPFAVSSLNANYTDSGLFGFIAAAKPEEMDKVLRAAIKEFGDVTKTGISDKEVARGKNQLKSNIGMTHESIEGQMIALAEQAMGSDRVVSVEEVCKMVDSITTADVNAVAKKLVNGKPSMSAVGNLSNTPFLDELYK